jgi:hypothetical protein
VQGAMDHSDKINADEYLKLVKDVIEPELEASPRSLTFVQENAPAHKAEKVLVRKPKHIQVLNYQPQSPVINHIKLILAVIKPKLDSENCFSNTNDELVTRVFQIRNEIPQDTFGNRM